MIPFFLINRTVQAGFNEPLTVCLHDYFLNRTNKILKKELVSAFVCFLCCCSLVSMLFGAVAVGNCSRGGNDGNQVLL